MKPYYEQDGITIYHGDCRDILPVLGADVLVTDPPYGIKRDGGFGGFEGFGGFGNPISRRQYEDDWDSDRPSQDTFSLMLRVTKTALIFGGNFFADLLPQGKHWIVWDKQNTMPTFGDAELIWTNVPRNSVKIRKWEYNGLLGKEDGRYHPTQKPLGLLTWLVEHYTSLGQTVIDPFMGSGTTIVAAMKVGRRATGIEIEERYCEIAANRLSQGVFDLSVSP